jgi:pyridoxine/pyridoxamine 5'-phosphate oxidase
VPDARAIIDSLMYMTLATADENGRPWASPVWFARASENRFLWASDPESRHSRNLAKRPELAIVIYDSTVPIGAAEAVYMEAVGEELTGAELERAVAVYSRRSVEVGAPEWTLKDVTPPARFRLYRASASAAYVLGSGDERLPASLSR